MARKKFNLGGAKPKEADWKAQLTAPTKEVSVSEIVTDPRLQHRAMMNPEAIADYAQVLTDGGELAPVKLMQTPDGKKYLYDGYHTLEAALASGRQTLKATIKRGTWREAWLESLGVNHDHGVRRSTSDKRKAVDDALSDPDIRDSMMAEDGKWSFRKVAKYTKTTHPFVSRRWERMYPPKPMSNESSASDLADSQNSAPSIDEGGNVSTQAQVGQVRATPDEGQNVTTQTQVGSGRATPDEGDSFSTFPESSEPNIHHGIPTAKRKITHNNSQINEIIDLATGVGADVIDLNDAEFAKVIYHLSDGKEYDVTMNKLNETIIILRFPHVSR